MRIASRDQAGNVSAGIIFDLVFKFGRHRHIIQSRMADPLQQVTGFPRLLKVRATPVPTFRMPFACGLSRSQAIQARAVFHINKVAFLRGHPAMARIIEAKRPSPSFADLLKGGGEITLCGTFSEYSFGIFKRY